MNESITGSRRRRSYRRFGCTVAAAFFVLTFVVAAVPTAPSPFATSVGALPTLSTSDAWLKDAYNHGATTIRLTTSPDWVMPVYHAVASDPTYVVAGFTLQIPLGATPMGGNDGAMIVYQPDGSAYALHHAVCCWTADGVSRARNNWVSGKFPDGEAFNVGHRGIPPQIMTVENADTVIPHALEVYWYETGPASGAVYPMSSGESGNSGVIPEGYVLRLRTNASTQALVNALPAKARTIAVALQTYGAVIGDNAGGDKNSIKLQRGFTGLSGSSLSTLALTSTHWAIVQVPQP